MDLALRLDDPDARYAAVRLASDLPLSDEERSFARVNGGWVLELEPPQVQRLEYQLELVGPDGRIAYAPDPGNPHRAPGAFGEKSVLLAPGYRPPAWLEAPAVEGRFDELSVRGRGLGATVAMRVWSPADADADTPLRLLLVHDGPEYDALASLTRFSAAKIAAGELPPHRVALLAPGDRDHWYSASKIYGRVLTHDLIPALRESFPTVDALVGMGASLGALAMLHAQRGFPRTFGALFLQSGSFFMPRYDAHERRFVRYARIVRFVRATLADGRYALPIPVALTAGTAEENLHNNRAMAAALAAQGYEATLAEVPDLHNYTGWRDAFDPHLTALLQRAWTR
jgi:enterochelin esterase family protein